MRQTTRPGAQKRKSTTRFTCERFIHAMRRGRSWYRRVHHATVLLLLDSVPEFRTLRKRQILQALPPQLRDLREALSGKAREHIVGFIFGVDQEFRPQRSDLLAIHRSRGFADGARWAVDFATIEQLRNLTRWTSRFGRSKNWTRDAWDRELFLSPAHFLFVWILIDAYPADENGRLVEDCELFQRFWAPFSRVPMSEVLNDLKNSTSAGRRHLLESPYYVDGFISGALGIAHGRQFAESLSVVAAECGLAGPCSSHVARAAH